jgi:hypothetical protein
MWLSVIVPGLFSSDDSSVTVALSLVPSPQLITAVWVFDTPGSVKAR